MINVDDVVDLFDARQPTVPTGMPLGAVELCMERLGEHLLDQRRLPASGHTGNADEPPKRESNSSCISAQPMSSTCSSRSIRSRLDTSPMFSGCIGTPDTSPIHRSATSPTAGPLQSSFSTLDICSVTHDMPSSSSAAPQSWRIWFLRASGVGLLIALVLGGIAAMTGATSPLLGDPRTYEESMAKLFAGQIPYVDFPFEHLPLSVLPMALVYVLSQATGLPYAAILALLSLAILFATGEIVVRIAAQMSVSGAGRRWVWLVGPILPLVIFRVDGLSVLLASSAVLLAIQQREFQSFASTIGGILARGWPVVGAASDWWRRKPARAIALAVGSALMGLSLLATPGFRSGREFVGIHQETIIGAIIATGRGIAGMDLGLVTAAGAVYVEVGQWALVVTFLVGIAMSALALLALRRRFSWPGSLSLTAALVFAIVLGSPLLSAQFVLWPMPFVAIVGSRYTRITLSVAGGMSMLLVGYWMPGSTFWHSFVVTRNVVLIVAAILALQDLRRLSAVT